MLKFSLPFAIRHLRKNKLYALIKVAGLAIGMACILLATLFIRDEHSFDRFHDKASQLYRITTINTRNGITSVNGGTSQVQGPAFKAHIPEVKDYARVWTDINLNMTGGARSLAVSTTYADASFFKLFSFPFIQGSAVNALDELRSVVLTEKTAIKFFGHTDVVGKTLEVDEGHGIEDFLITGVVQNVPSNSSLQFDAVLPFRYLQTMFNDHDWLNSYVSTFLLLSPGADVQKLEQEFSTVLALEAREQLKQAGLGANAVAYGLQPLTDVHLNVFKGQRSEGGSQAKPGLYIYSFLLGAIAVFIMIMACVNFLNLSIAGFMERSKEVGVRKITGGTSRQIVAQFLGEAAVVGSLAYIAAITLALAALPIFNRLSEKNIHISLPRDLPLFALGLLLTIICVCLVGLYPAMKLAWFNAVNALSNKQKWSGRNYLGKSLIVLQFALAMGLVFSCIIYYRQMNFIAGRDLGYNPSDVINIEMPPRRSDERAIALFKNELRRSTAVQFISNGGLYQYDTRELAINGATVKAPRYFIDAEYVPVMGIRIKQGRNFNAALRSDSNAILVNESFVKQAGWTNPLLQQVALPEGPPKTVIGVVGDYNTASLKSAIEPQLFELKHNGGILVKAQKGRTAEALAAIERVFKKQYADHYYRFSFMDDVVSAQYAQEQRWKQIITYAAVLAIVVCCIGLFGLAHFATIKRRKEISIRKVLGASVINLVRLVSDDFLQLVLLAVIIVAPVVWYSMNGWLQQFSYRISVSFIDIGITIAIAVLIAMLTVGAQVLRTALQNPVKNLRPE